MACPFFLCVCICCLQPLFTPSIIPNHSANCCHHQTIILLNLKLLCIVGTSPWRVRFLYVCVFVVCSRYLHHQLFPTIPTNCCNHQPNILLNLKLLCMVGTSPWRVRFLYVCSFVVCSRYLYHQLFPTIPTNCCNQQSNILLNLKLLCIVGTSPWRVRFLYVCSFVVCSRYLYHQLFPTIPTNCCNHQPNILLNLKLLYIVGTSPWRVRFLYVCSFVVCSRYLHHQLFPTIPQIVVIIKQLFY